MKKTLALAVTTLCLVASMTLWFAASNAAAHLFASGVLSGQRTALVTGSVQLGFVAGTLLSASLGLADRIDPRRFFALCAALASAANFSILYVGFDHWLTVVARFITGVMLAGVYPIGMKLAAGWAERRLGLMIGMLIAALTLGSALPHLFNVIAEVSSDTAIVISSVLALAAAVMINTVQLGPKHLINRRFVPMEAWKQLLTRPILLANAGYLGHMWELYAMWTWIGVFLAWSFDRASSSTSYPVGLITFLVISSGAFGCVIAGALADRYGRTLVIICALAVSGTCAVLIGPTADISPWFTIALAMIWGISVIADSAQFSASIAELSEPDLVGTMLTVQTCAGFLLTFFTIQLIPFVVHQFTWRYAFAVLAIGPVLGIIATWKLRGCPHALRMADGRR